MFQRKSKKLGCIMEHLPMMDFSKTLIKAGVSCWWYDFIGIPWFDVTEDQLSFLSRRRVFLWRLISPKFPLAIDMKPSPSCVYFPSIEDVLWSVLSPTYCGKIVPCGQENRLQSHVSQHSTWIELPGNLKCNLNLSDLL